jgi:hypothetical protein
LNIEITFEATKLLLWRWRSVVVGGFVVVVKMLLNTGLAVALNGLQLVGIPPTIDNFLIGKIGNVQGKEGVIVHGMKGNTRSVLVVIVVVICFEGRMKGRLHGSGDFVSCCNGKMQKKRVCASLAFFGKVV